MILIVAALIPTYLLMIYVYKLDQIEKEPMGLLIKTFLLGGIMAIPIIICETILTNVIGLVLPQGS